MEANQELIFKLSMFEQQIQQINQQVQAVEEGIIELRSLKNGLGEIKNSNGKEIMASIGKGIFIKAKIISDELNVDIGEKNFVKKSVSETQEIIESQIRKLEGVRIELDENLETLGNEAKKIIEEAEKENSKRFKN